jgi:frizzled protein 5/8
VKLRRVVPIALVVLSCAAAVSCTAVLGIDDLNQGETGGAGPGGAGGSGGGKGGTGGGKGGTGGSTDAPSSNGDATDDVSTS